jgi:hypothetical protein
MPSQGIIEPAQITLGEMSANTTHGRSPGRRENVDSIYRFALFHRCLRGHSPQHFRAGHRLYIIIRPTAPPTTKWNHRVGIIKEEHYYSTMYSSIGKGIFENGKE